MKTRSRCRGSVVAWPKFWGFSCMHDDSNLNTCDSLLPERRDCYFLLLSHPEEVDQPTGTSRQDVKTEQVINASSRASRRGGHWRCFSRYYPFINWYAISIGQNGKMKVKSGKEKIVWNPTSRRYGKLGDQNHRPPPPHTWFERYAKGGLEAQQRTNQPFIYHISERGGGRQSAW